jgi:hypothetical protein
MAKKTRAPRPPKKLPDDMPRVLYAVVGGGDDQTLFGYADFETFDHGDRIGVYELREVRTLHVTRGLR